MREMGRTAGPKGEAQWVGLLVGAGQVCVGRVNG